MLDQLATLVFNNSRKFPVMSSPPAYIHVKEDSTPKAKHKPILVPYHNKEQVRQDFGEDVTRDIITPVPISHHCKNGKPRKTVDYQHLNSQCKQKTYHTSSLFQLSLQIPSNTKKTNQDAVDGYHSINSGTQLEKSSLSFQIVNTKSGLMDQEGRKDHA